MGFTLSYNGLLGYLHRGLRNGKWYKLSCDDRAMYRAGLEFAKVNCEVRNPIIVSRLLGIVERIRSTVKTILLRVGSERALEMLSRYEGRGVFEWLPQLGDWLRSQTYIIWLGTLRMNCNILFR